MRDRLAARYMSHVLLDGPFYPRTVRTLPAAILTAISQSPGAARLNGLHIRQLAGRGLVATVAATL